MNLARWRLVAALALLWLGCSEADQATPGGPEVVFEAPVECEVCADDDPCTFAFCPADGTCINVPRQCGGCVAAEDGLALSHALGQGAGGLDLPAGWRDVEVVPADGGADIYVGTSIDGGVIHARASGGDLAVVGVTALPHPATQLALTATGLVAGGAEGITLLSRGAGGALSPGPFAEVDPSAICAGSERVVWLAGGAITVAGPDLVAIESIPAPHLGATRACALSADDRTLFVAGFDASAVEVYDLDSGEAVLTAAAQAGLGGADSLALSADGRRLAVGGVCDDDAALFRVSTDPVALEYLGSAFGRAAKGAAGCETLEELGDDGGYTPLSQPAAVALSADGSRMAIVGSDQYLNVRFIETAGAPSVTGFLAEQPAWNGANKTHFEMQAAAYALPFEYAIWRGAVAAAGGAGGFAITSFRADALAWVPAEGEVRYLQAGAGGLRGLSSAYNLAVSPDGRNVYVASRESTGIRVGAFAIEGGGVVPVAAEPRALPEFWQGGLTDVAVRPDGAEVLVVEGDFGEVHRFDRHPAAGGALTHRGAVPLPGCQGRPSFPVGVKVTADGRHALVSDYHDDVGCLHVLGWRDGALDLQETRTEAFLKGIENTASTRDGRHVYAAAFFGPGVAHYLRDPETGALTAEAPLLAEEMLGIENVVLTPAEDGALVANPFKHRLFSLSRDPATGALSLVQTLERSDALPIDGASGVAVSPDGTRVYVACRDSDSVQAFARDESGHLAHLGGLRDTTRLRWPNGLVSTPDGTLLLAASVGSNRIVALRPLDDTPCPR